MVMPDPHAALHDAAAEPAVHRDHPRQTLVVVVGSPKALAIAVKRADSGKRITMLKERLVEYRNGSG